MSSSVKGPKPNVDWIVERLKPDKTFLAIKTKMNKLTFIRQKYAVSTTIAKEALKQFAKETLVLERFYLEVEGTVEKGEVKESLQDYSRVIINTLESMGVLSVVVKVLPTSGSIHPSVSEAETIRRITESPIEPLFVECTRCHSMKGKHVEVDGKDDNLCEPCIVTLSKQGHKIVSAEPEVGAKLIKRRSLLERAPPKFKFCAVPSCSGEADHTCDKCEQRFCGKHHESHECSPKVV